MKIETKICFQKSHGKTHGLVKTPGYFEKADAILDCFSDGKRGQLVKKDVRFRTNTRYYR